jgi:ubiquinone/menaquinone biosynthesis C-methylase UbiE
MENLHLLIQKQIAYYQARAPEYDEWFLRQGRYDHGVELNNKWFLEVEQVRKSLDKFQPGGKVLELACGTGLWTQQLLGHAQQITAIDSAMEALDLNRQRVQSAKVKYIQADIFTWLPDERYDVIFFSFWLSHVPPEYFESFWQMVGRSLKRGGRVFFVDSRYDSTSTARDHQLGDAQAHTMQRRLNDGSEYEIVKIYYQCKQLEAKLAQLGWSIIVNETPSYFIFGYGGRTNEAP